METVVVVLMILVCFNFMMKQTFRKRGSVAAIAVVATLFVGLMWPYAIQQSKTQIADWLANVQFGCAYSGSCLTDGFLYVGCSCAYYRAC